MNKLVVDTAFDSLTWGHLPFQSITGNSDFYFRFGFYNKKWLTNDRSMFYHNITINHDSMHINILIS